MTRRSAAEAALSKNGKSARLLNIALNISLFERQRGYRLLVQRNADQPRRNCHRSRICPGPPHPNWVDKESNQEKAASVQYE